MGAYTSRRFRLAKRPQGFLRDEDLELVHESLPEIKTGQVLIRTKYLSLDPTNRIWMSDVDQYLPPVAIGEVMRGLGLAEVLQSSSSVLKPGDFVTGMVGWQDYSVGAADQLSKVELASGAPMSAYLGVLGMTGLTAYFGMEDIGKARKGETVVVSAASGAVGSVVGQIARIKGARAVGICGSNEKCQRLVKDFGFTAAVNYQDEDFPQKLLQACPDGVDVYFENVGGRVADTVFGLLNLYARIPLCGLISQYNSQEPTPGPYNYPQLLMKRATLQGFIILDYVQRFPEGLAKLTQWWRDGRLKSQDTIVKGLENAPRSLNRLFSGEKLGKLLVEIG